MAHHGTGMGTDHGYSHNNTVAVAPAPPLAQPSPPPPQRPRPAFGAVMSNWDMHHTNGNGGNGNNDKHNNNAANASTLPTSPASSISPPLHGHSPHERDRRSQGAPPSAPSPVAVSPVPTSRQPAATTRSGGVTPNGTHHDDRYRTNGNNGGNGVLVKSSATGRHISSDNVMDATGAATMAAQTLAEMTAAVRQNSIQSPTAAHDLTAIHTISFHGMNEPSPESQAAKAALYRTVRTSLFTLRFADPRIEAEFTEHYRQRYIGSLINSLKVGTLIWAGFIGYDIGRFVDGKTSYFTETIITRIVALLCGILTIFIIGRLKYLHHVERLIAVLMTVVGTAQILFGIWDDGNTLDPTYSMFLIVVSSICPTLLRQRFVVSFWCNLGLLVFFIILSAGTSSFNSQNDFVLQVCGLLVSNGIFGYYAYNREQHLRDGFLTENRLRIEEQMCNSLLEKMLPQTVIAQLRVGVDFVYEKHSNVTVLFSHIDDFDHIAAALTAHEVVALLNTVFSAFDALTDQWSVYKIETIGDVYLVASNCPAEFKRRDHASAICGLALDMAADATRPRLSQLARQPVRLKLGINSGAVIAGVVGMRCPRYRLMGDTMNVGSRMSTTCEPGEIQMSQATYAQVQGEFVIESRGEIPIKGKGMMTTYLLKGHRHSHKNRQSPEPHTLLPFTVPESTFEGSGTKTSSYARTNSTGQRVIESNGTLISTSGRNGRNANRLSLDRSATAKVTASPVIVPVTAPNTNANGTTNGMTSSSNGDASLQPPSSPLMQSGTSPRRFASSHIPPPSDPAAVLAAMLPHAPSSVMNGTGNVAPIGGAPPSPGTRGHHDFVNKTRASFAVGSGVDDSGSDMDDDHDELSYSAPASFDPTARRHSDSKETAAVNLIIRQKANRIKGDSVNKRNRWQARTSGGQGALSRITSTASMVAASLNGGDSSSRPQSAFPPTGERPAGPVPPTPSASHGPISAAPSARGGPPSVPGSPNPGANGNEVKMASIPRGSLSPRPSSRWPSSSPTLQPAGSSVMAAATIPMTTLASAPSMIATNGNVAMTSIPLSPPHTTTAVHTIAALTPAEAAEAAARAEADMEAIAAAVASQIPQVPAGSTLTISAHPQAFGYNRMFECPPAEVVLQTPKVWYRRWSLLFEEYPELEWRFQCDYQPRFVIPNRGGIILLTCSFALLAVYDTLVGFENDASYVTRMAAMIIRVVGVIIGIVLYATSRHRIYGDYMQVASSTALTIMGLCFITITALLDTYSEAYGVGCVLILLAIMSMQIGLQWRYSIWSTIVLLAYYIIAGEIWRAVPTVVVMLFIGGLLYSQASHASEYFVREDFVRRIKLKNEHTRSAAFLQHMLPSTVIDELSRMAGQIDQYVAHERPNCSVFFCDIVSFTTLASSIPPEDVVAILNVIFATFDALTSHFDVYKVETIGDAYLCCSGVVGEMEGHSQRLLECALGFQESIQYFRTPNDKELKLRIGIHTGPLLAGVVGMKMPRYHLFGETVTIAEEMEQKGIPGAVAICEDTYTAVQGINTGQPDDLDFVAVAPLILKNGRSLKRYMVQLPNVVEAHVLRSGASNAGATTTGGIPVPPSPRGPALAGHVSNAALTSLPGSAIAAAAIANNTNTNTGEPLSTRGTTPNGTLMNGSGMGSPLAAFLLAADVVNLTASHHRRNHSISINSAPSPDLTTVTTNTNNVSMGTSTGSGTATPIGVNASSGNGNGTGNNGANGLASITSINGHPMPRFLQRRPSFTQQAALQTLQTLGSPISAEAQATLGSSSHGPRRLAPLGGHIRHGTGSGGSGDADSSPIVARDRSRSIAHAGHRPPPAPSAPAPPSRGPSTTAIHTMHPHHAPTQSIT